MFEMRRFFLIFLFIVCLAELGRSQINYGTTGLMNMPTADMQRDKTVMAGANWLNHHATVPRWWYDTWNYYINITIFPWLEAGYLCTGHKAVPVDYGNQSGYWVPPHTAGSSIRTVPFISVCGCGKKAGGKNGHPR